MIFSFLGGRQENAAAVEADEQRAEEAEKEGKAYRRVLSLKTF
jgi:hypothetical protein